MHLYRQILYKSNPSSNNQWLLYTEQLLFSQITYLVGLHIKDDRIDWHIWLTDFLCGLPNKRCKLSRV